MDEEIIAGVGAGAVKATSFWLLPTGKWSLIIASIFFLSMFVVGVYQSAEQKNLLPLFDNTILLISASDSKVGVLVDDLSSAERPHFTYFFSHDFLSWLWFWIVFWYTCLIDLFFIYFLCLLLYLFWRGVNSDSLWGNIFKTVISFVLISMFAGMIIFNMGLSGKCLTDDKTVLLGSQMSSAIPLHGTFKLFTYFINKDLFFRLNDFSKTFVGSSLSNIPPSYNVSGVNSSV